MTKIIQSRSSKSWTKSVIRCNHNLQIWLKRLAQMLIIKAFFFPNSLWLIHSLISSSSSMLNHSPVMMTTVNYWWLIKSCSISMLSAWLILATASINWQPCIVACLCASFSPLNVSICIGMIISTIALLHMCTPLFQYTRTHTCVHAYGWEK